MSAADEMVECPECEGTGCASIVVPNCETCGGAGEITEERHAEMLRDAAEMRDTADDDRAHAWRERLMEDRR